VRKDLVHGDYLAIKAARFRQSRWRKTQQLLRVHSLVNVDRSCNKDWKPRRGALRGPHDAQVGERGWDFVQRVHRLSSQRLAGVRDALDKGVAVHGQRGLEGLVQPGC
jgi:hypothetical protein